MKLGSKISALLLIVTIASAMFAEADHFSVPKSRQQESNAGCHAHAGKNLPTSERRPEPSSYKCCLTGHDAAIVLASDLPRCPAQCAQVLLRIGNEQRSSSSEFFNLRIAITNSSSHPPDLTSLRI
jgi:hypothetical protein